MKLRWIEGYRKPCYEVAELIKPIEARIINENDTPDLVEYKKTPIERGYIILERERIEDIPFYLLLYYIRYSIFGWRFYEYMIEELIFKMFGSYPINKPEILYFK